jgi:hypothetical protein
VRPPNKSSAYDTTHQDGAGGVATSGIRADDSEDHGSASPQLGCLSAGRNHRLAATTGNRWIAAGSRSGELTGSEITTN